MRIVEGEELARDARAIRQSRSRGAQPPLFSGVAQRIRGADGLDVLLRDHQGRVAERQVVE